MALHLTIFSSLKDDKRHSVSQIGRGQSGYRSWGQRGVATGSHRLSGLSSFAGPRRSGRPARVSRGSPFYLAQVVGQKFEVDGSHFNDSLLKASLIDELSLLHYPVVDGAAGSAAVFEQGEQPGPSIKLWLHHMEQLPGALVWLHYDVVGR